MNNLTKSQIMELRARAIYEAKPEEEYFDGGLIPQASGMRRIKWDNLTNQGEYIKRAIATIEADEKAGVLMLVEGIYNNEFNDATDSIEYQTWNCTKTDDLEDNEPVEIKVIKSGAVFDATWSVNDECFYIGWEGMFYPYEVKFRKKYPEEMFERVARSYVQRANTPVYQCKAEEK